KGFWDRTPWEPILVAPSKTTGSTAWDGSPEKFPVWTVLAPVCLAVRARLNRACRDFGDFLESEKLQQRMPDVGLDKRQSLHRASHRNVERVDIEFVQFKRLVRLVFRPAVIEFISLEVGRNHVPAQIGVDRAVAGDQIEKDDVRIFEAFRLMNGKDERRPEMRAGGGLVLVAQNDHRAVD